MWGADGLGQGAPTAGLDTEAWKEGGRPGSGETETPGNVGYFRPRRPGPEQGSQGPLPPACSSSQRPVSAERAGTQGERGRRLEGLERAGPGGEARARSRVGTKVPPAHLDNSRGSSGRLLVSAYTDPGSRGLQETGAVPGAAPEHRDSGRSQTGVSPRARPGSPDIRPDHDHRVARVPVGGAPNSPTQQA